MAGVLLVGCETGGNTPPAQAAGRGSVNGSGGKLVEVPINPAPKVDRPPLSGTTATLIVHGLSCPSCAAGVLRELKRLEGVTDVEVDPVQGEALIEFKEGKGPTYEQLRQAISWGGGVLVDVEQP